MGDFVFAGGIVLLVLLGPWVLVWRVNSRRKRERQEDQERWRELTSRIYVVEEAVLERRAQRSSPTAEEATRKTTESPAATSYAPTFSSPSIVAPPLCHRPLNLPPSPVPRSGSPKTGSQESQPSPRRQDFPPAPSKRFRPLPRRSHHCLRRVSPRPSRRRRWPTGSNRRSMSKRCWARIG